MLLNYLVVPIIFVLCVIVLMIVIIALMRKWHESYLRYVDCFLINEDRKIGDKLYRLFRAYFFLGFILAVAFTFIETDFDVATTKTCFYRYFLSSCFFLFIARTYTTTATISANPNIKRITRHMNHINFLAFFGMVTGILELLISAVQSPELMKSRIDIIIDTTVILEVGISATLFPITHLLIGTLLIPSLFSLGELVLILKRDNSQHPLS